MNFNQFDIHGKTIGLTGGGGYLGRAIALGLAAAGANVFICGRNEEKLRQVAEEASKKSIAGQIFYQTADITNIDSVLHFLNFIYQKTTVLSGWVNNAASISKQLLGELDKKGISSTFDSCLTQVMLITQAVSQRMENSGKGSIVNISSMYGIVSPQPNLYDDFSQFHNPPAYGVSKAGVIQFSKYAACHLAKYNIRVNCISPGPFPTELVQNHKKFVNELEKRVPLQRIGKADELVGPALFLLSDASSFITGHNLVVDGGWSIW